MKKDCTAKVAHRCAACGGTVEAGSSAVYEWKGKGRTSFWHPACLSVPSPGARAPGGYLLSVTDRDIRSVMPRALALGTGNTAIDERVRTAVGGRDDWVDQCTLVQAGAILDHPDLGLRAQVETSRDRILSGPGWSGGSASPRRRVRADRHEGDLDVGRYVSRDRDDPSPAIWDRTVRVPAPGRRLVLAASIAASCGWGRSDYAARGAVVAGLVEAAGSMGWSVEAWASARADDLFQANGRRDWAGMVKPSDRPVDIGILTGVYADIRWVRIGVFCGVCRLAEGGQIPQSGLGWPKDIPVDVLATMIGVTPDIVVPWDLQGAELTRWTDRTLAALRAGDIGGGMAAA